MKDFSQILVEKSALGSPNSNFTFEEQCKIDNMHEKLVDCGTVFQEYVTPQSEIKVFPKYCNNRSCDNAGCMDHRLYLFMREHHTQIDVLNKSMKKPKGWVFSGWKIPLKELTREFCQSKLLFLFQLLKRFSVSEFSVHMEIKIYPDSDDCYLHFHVVSGGFKNLRYIRKVWNRQIKYESAILPKELGYYVSKYASKTPKFTSEDKRELYHLLVYKTQMHRFSCKKGQFEVNSNWVCLDFVRYEVESSLWRDSYMNPSSIKKRYHHFLEEKPPPLGFVQTQLFGYEDVEQNLDIPPLSEEDIVRVDDEIKSKRGIWKKQRKLNESLMSRLKECCGLD